MSSLRDEFVAHGVVRVPGAFPREAAEAVASTVWGSIERRTNVRRRDPSTWPAAGALSGVSFKSLQGRRVFEPVVRSERVGAALDAIMGEGRWLPPKVRAQILLTFPTPGPWVFPSGWHIDGSFDVPVWPAPAIRMFSCFDTVAPEGGGTLLLEGSHHVVERYLAEHETPIPGNSVTWGRFMRHHPALAELQGPHDHGRTGRAHIGRAIDVDGICVRPIEVTGDPGDLFLAHFYVLHTGAPNVSDRPRQMLSTTARLSPPAIAG